MSITVENLFITEDYSVIQHSQDRKNGKILITEAQELLTLKKGDSR